MQTTDYTLKEMMAIMAAREIKDGDIVFAGTGISMLAATAAKNINAPNSIIFFETGAIDSLVEELPLAVADPRVMYYSASNAGLLQAFYLDVPSGPTIVITALAAYVLAALASRVIGART